MRVGLIQSSLIWHDPIANCDHFEQRIEEFLTDVDLVVLPEMFTTGFTMNSSTVAEGMDGPTVQWMRHQAAKSGAVIGGSLVIREGGNYFNRFVWMRPDGQASVYDKRHLFRMAGEHLYYSPGKERVVVTLGDFRICLTICYDLRFPVFFRSKNDYDALLCVANWPAERQDAWEILLRARAIENQVYVSGVNRVGSDGSDIHYRGGTAVYNYLGDTLERSLDRDSTFVIEIHKAALENYRKSFPVSADADRFEVQV